MKRKNWSLFFIGMLAMCAIAGCSDDELNGNKGINPGHPDDAVYMNVTVQLPVAGGNTRSETDSDNDDDYGTSTDGTEVGKDYENIVSQILLVLADKNDNFITCGEQHSLKTETNGKVNTTQKINKSTLAAYYKENGEAKDQDIHIYVFCNPTQELLNIFKTGPAGNNWVNEVAEFEESPNGEVAKGGDILGNANENHPNHKKGFLMSTATRNGVEKEIPARFSYWEDYTTADKAFNFSGINGAENDLKYVDNGKAIPVERAVARFDFKDGSKEGDQIYTIAENEDNKATLQIKLTKMALVNMSKHFYYLRRISSNGMDTNSKIAGTETGNNYVVDTDSEQKSTQTLGANYGYDKYFNFCLGHVENNEWSIDQNARGQWYTSQITDVLESEKDNEWKPTNKEDYHIWRYVTENTIPADEKLERNGITTGIVFKGKMLTTENTPKSLKDAIEGVKVGGSTVNPILYSYENKLYVRWGEVRAAAIKAGPTETLYKRVFGENNTAEVTFNENPQKATYSNDHNSPDYLWKIWNLDDKAEENTESLKKFKKAATDAKFTLYEASVDETDNQPGYYCYYYYWNRHNDNGNDGVMGPMEFAVVRNNVYKLAVTKIERLGHPRITENDPDPVDPNNPDEKGDVYLKLSVEVLPWVVRVNDIEF